MANSKKIRKQKLVPQLINGVRSTRATILKAEYSKKMREQSQTTKDS